MPSQRVSQRVHCRYRGIGKGLPRHHCTQQASFPGNQITALLHCRSQIAPQQAQRFTGQHVGVRVFLVRTGIRLDGMHHGIHAGCGRHVRRQPQGQLGVQHSQIRQQRRRHNARLGGRTGGHDCHRRHFRAGTSSRRHLHQRQSRPRCQANAVDIGQLLAGLGV